jgi:hypothetical protein
VFTEAVEEDGGRKTAGCSMVMVVNYLKKIDGIVDE